MQPTPVTSKGMRTMSKTVTKGAKSADKTKALADAAKIVSAPVGVQKAPSKAKPKAAMSETAQAILSAAEAAAKKKADREAERAKRFPTAAKEEAAAKAEKKTRAPGEVKEKAPKVVRETVAFVNRLLKKGAPVHVLGINARPTSGTRLTAHTHAALSILGMLDAKCPAVAVSAVKTIMGDRAIVYHTKQNNFVSGPDHTIALSPAGRNHFLARTIDGKVANAFVDMFLDGKVDEATLGVKAGEVFQAKF